MCTDSIGYIIKNLNEYLVAVPYKDTLVKRWSISPYDGCMIYSIENAIRVAKKVGGEVVRFNPINGQMTLEGYQRQ